MLRPGFAMARGELFGDPIFRWTRFSQYEIRAGYIRPRKAAELIRYNPWQDYLQSELKGYSRPDREGPKPPERPYQSLLDLVSAVADGSSVADQEAISRWCGDHGLLGILSHTTSMVRLAPRVEEIKYAGSLEKHAVQRELVRRWQSWGSSKRAIDPRVSKLPEGRAVPELQWSRFFQPPEAFVLRADFRPAKGFIGGGVRWQWRELGDAWAYFFPDVPYSDEHPAYADEYDYPVPLAAHFWKEYAEPVHEFLKWANILRCAITDEAGAAGPNFTVLLDSVRPVFIPKTEDSPAVRGWASQSLIGAYAMMAYLDLTSGGQPVVCESCSKVFLSSRRDAKFCSNRCRWRIDKQNERDEKI
jgi:hypothetical protein